MIETLLELEHFNQEAEADRIAFLELNGFDIGEDDEL